jgi:hypothetical protein
LRADGHGAQGGGNDQGDICAAWKSHLLNGFIGPVAETVLEGQQHTPKTTKPSERSAFH